MDIMCRVLRCRRVSKPPSAREVAARSADGERDAARFTAERRPLQLLCGKPACPFVGGDAHIAPPLTTCLHGGTHGSRPTGCGGRTGQTESSAPTHRRGDPRFPLPPSAREVAARSADGGRDAARFTAGHRPLQLLCGKPACPFVGGDAHIAPPLTTCFRGGTHGSRPTGCGVHAGRTGSSAPTTGRRTGCTSRRFDDGRAQEMCLYCAFKRTGSTI